MSFTHHKFPYRLEHGQGTCALADDVLQVQPDGLQRKPTGPHRRQVAAPLSAPVGWMEIKGEDCRWTRSCSAALPERPRAVARPWTSAATISFQYHLWRQSPRGAVAPALFVRANRCWLRYEQFPYSLANIRGTLTMIDGNWTFRGLEGTNGASRVTCEGELTATPPGPRPGVALLSASDVPLEDELRDALPPAMRQVWDDLSRGA